MNRRSRLNLHQHTEDRAWLSMTRHATKEELASPWDCSSACLTDTCPKAVGFDGCSTVRGIHVSSLEGCSSQEVPVVGTPKPTNRPTTLPRPSSGFTSGLSFLRKESRCSPPPRSTYGCLCVHRRRSLSCNMGCLVYVNRPN